jgi:DNA-binding NarL/FixJ family response regulator
VREARDGGFVRPAQYNRKTLQRKGTSPMSTHSPVVLLVAPPGAVVPDVLGPITDAGFTPLRFGDPTPPTPAAVIILADTLDDPVPFTRRLRTQSEPRTPVLWLLSKETADRAAAGLDAGADACLLRPVSGPLLVAQLRALMRARTVTASADELRDLTARLQRLYDQSEQDAGLVTRLAELLPTTVPDGDGWRFGVATDGGLDVVSRDGRRAVILMDVAGLGGVGGGITASAVTRALSQSLA